MTSSVLLVRMDIKNSQDDRAKVLWHLAADEKDAKEWLAVMEFDHVELANDAGSGMGRGGTKYSETRLIPAKDIASMRLAEMGQMNLGDLMSLFGVINAGIQAASHESDDQVDSDQSSAKPATRTKSAVSAVATSPKKGRSKA